MKSVNSHCPVILQTGFRIFFLGAAVYAVLSMVFWLVFYVFQANLFVAMPLTVWHGHEMIFGFTMAVVAGFLLTAVMNWTGLPTLSGRPLLVLFLLWAVARVLAFMPASFPVWPMAFCDSAFIVFLSVAVIRPIIAVKQWKQSAVFSKVLLLLASNIVFYIALMNTDLAAERKALRFAVYMIVSLTLTIGRRILPFFIERGVGYPVTLRNSRFLDITSMFLLLGFSVIDIFCNWPVVVAVICALLVVIHSLRLAGWYTYGIWEKPLLWILFVGYSFLILGFFLKIFAVLYHHPDDAALHAFTAGGIGTFTLGMMTRVSWGHTGRNIAEAPAALPLMFFPIALGAVIRVCSPVLTGPSFAIAIGISQILWLAAFILYLIFYSKVLTSPRPDGKWG
ncbi:MAG: NnrS family protein [Candidatus Omnitrophica bacterium]|nr:NnrS family protein [Candidatus Omnitrophota bacterium]